MFYNKEEEQLMLDSRRVLNELNEANKNKNKTLYENYQQNYGAFDHGKSFFEEYDELSWENKIKIDMLFYEQLIQKLNEDNTEVVNNVLSNLYKSINEVYKFINIKPEVYGKRITEGILSESNETIKRKLSKIIYEYLDNNFYSLSPTQRKSKYEEAIHENAADLIRKHVPPKDAITFSAKVAVMEGLIKSIAFPFAVKSRLDYLLENEDFRFAFAVEELEESKNNFDKYCHEISKVIATCV